MVSGFHKRIQEWWCKVIEWPGPGAKEQKAKSNYLRTNRIYTMKDKISYGSHVPIVCGPGDIRVSKAEILHGSTATGTKKAVAHNIRYVVNPWFVGVQPDHLTLDVPQEGTWETISQTHRDLTTLKATRSGQTNIHGQPVGKFPGSVPLNYISHLSDTLVGRSRCNDPLVQLGSGVGVGQRQQGSLALC